MSGLDPALITAIAAIVVAFLSGWFSYSSGRGKIKVDYAQVIQTGFKSLLEEMEKQHEDDQKDIRQCKEVVRDLSEKVANLTLYIAKLEFFLRSRGIWDEAPKHDLIGIPRLGNGK